MQKEIKDTLYVNGKIYLGKGKFAQAMLVRDGRFAGVGTNSELNAAAATAETIDLKGACVLPGLNDSHMHLLEVGRDLSRIDLYGCRSLQELQQRCTDFLRRRSLPRNETAVGNGWNQDLFVMPRIPTRTDLDFVCRDRPLILNRVCGHILSCNTAALSAAGITETTPVPAGGGIELGADGKPNGVLRDNAIALLDPLLPTEDVRGIKAAYQSAMAHAAACGLTSVQTNDSSAKDWPLVFAALQELEDDALLTLRMTMQCSLDTPEALEDFVRRGPHGGKLWHTGPLKLFLDGSLGARTAWLSGGYADLPGEHGLCCLAQSKAQKMVRFANAHGMSAAAHAIGDAAITEMLDVCRAVDPTGTNPLRNAVVHCQITTPEQWHRFAAQNISAMVQPVFLDYDRQIAAARCGEVLAASSYAFGTAAALGVHVSYGTDSPVEDLNPFANLYCAVTRCGFDGSPLGGWHPQERVSREEALAHYTVESAWAEFAEQEKGRIAPGFLADFVVIDRDYFTIPEAQIKEIQVLRTVVGGREVYRS
jgi:predicted amidohydrolase YtcJ